jgi:hypothetical protein
MEDTRRLYLDAIIAREGHRILARTGRIPSLPQLDIHVRTAADYDQRLDSEPGFEEARRKLIESHLDELQASRN